MTIEILKKIKQMIDRRESASKSIVRCDTCLPSTFTFYNSLAIAAQRTLRNVQPVLDQDNSIAETESQMIGELQNSGALLQSIAQEVLARSCNTSDGRCGWCEKASCKHIPLLDTLLN